MIGDMTIAEVLAGGWGSTTNMLIFFMIMVAAIVEQSGCSRFIAMFLITRKWVLANLGYLPSCSSVLHSFWLP